MKRSHHDKHHHSAAPYEVEPEKLRDIAKFNESVRDLAFKTIKSILPTKITELTTIIKVNKSKETASTYSLLGGKEAFA